MINSKVRSEIESEIFVIEISNPDQNVIDIEVLIGLAQEISKAISDETINAVLIKSTGNDFSIGYDGSC
ncbi:MAG: hypothetical protein ACYDDC_08410, partial [Thermoplasmataceae archaeon]